MLTREEIKQAWENLGDISINDNDEIEEDFVLKNGIRWEKGTCKFDIWHWFDENSELKVADLLMGLT